LYSSSTQHHHTQKHTELYNWVKFAHYHSLTNRHNLAAALQARGSMQQASAYDINSILFRAHLHIRLAK